MKHAVLAFGLAIALLVPRLQAEDKIPVVGVVVTHAPITDAGFDRIRNGMREYGLEDGRNVRLEIVTAAGQMERVQGIADDFVRKQVAIIVAPNEPATRAAMKATSTIPILMLGFSGDPVKLGIVDSVGRPKGNVTGVHVLPDSLDGKRLEILKDALPAIRSVAVFWHAPFGEKAIVEIQRAGGILGVRVDPIEVKSAEDFEPAFKAIKKKKLPAAMSTFSPVFYLNRERLGQLALKYKVPMMTLYGNDGTDTLLAYGTDAPGAWSRSGYYIHRLLKGTKPSDLPIEEVSTFKMKVNMKTARSLGLKLPQSVLVQATEAID